MTFLVSVHPAKRGGIRASHRPTPPESQGYFTVGGGSLINKEDQKGPHGNVSS